MRHSVLVERWRREPEEGDNQRPKRKRQRDPDAGCTGTGRGERQGGLDGDCDQVLPVAEFTRLPHAVKGIEYARDRVEHHL